MPGLGSILMLGNAGKWLLRLGGPGLIVVGLVDTQHPHVLGQDLGYRTPLISRPDRAGQEDVYPVARQHEPGDAGHIVRS